MATPEKYIPQNLGYGFKTVNGKTTRFQAVASKGGQTLCLDEPQETVFAVKFFSSKRKCKEEFNLGIDVAVPAGPLPAKVGFSAGFSDAREESTSDYYCLVQYRDVTKYSLLEPNINSEALTLFNAKIDQEEQRQIFYARHGDHYVNAVYEGHELLIVFKIKIKDDTNKREIKTRLGIGDNTVGEGSISFGLLRENARALEVSDFSLKSNIVGLALRAYKDFDEFYSHFYELMAEVKDARTAVLKLMTASYSHFILSGIDKDNEQLFYAEVEKRQGAIPIKQIKFLERRMQRYHAKLAEAKLAVGQLQLLSSENDVRRDLIKQLEGQQAIMKRMRATIENEEINLWRIDDFNPVVERIKEWLQANYKPLKFHAHHLLVYENPKLKAPKTSKFYTEENAFVIEIPAQLIPKVFFLYFNIQNAQLPNYRLRSVNQSVYASEVPHHAFFPASICNEEEKGTTNKKSPRLLLLFKDFTGEFGIKVYLSLLTKLNDYVKETFGALAMEPDTQMVSDDESEEEEQCLSLMSRRAP